MAAVSSVRRAGRRSGARLVAGAVLLCAAISAPAFVGPSASNVALRGRVAVHAEAEAKESVALVKITEESSKTTASVLGGVLGLLIGGIWVGGTLFTISSYLARKEDNDISKALKGVAAGSLEALNFTDYLNNKYTVTDKVGSALSDALEKQKAGSNAQAAESVGSFLDAAGKAISDADKDIGLKSTLGNLVTSASDLAFQALDKAVELNDQYKITDQIKEKIDAQIDGAKKA